MRVGKMNFYYSFSSWMSLTKTLFLLITSLVAVIDSFVYGFCWSLKLCISSVDRLRFGRKVGTWETLELQTSLASFPQKLQMLLGNCCPIDCQYRRHEFEWVQSAGWEMRQITKSSHLPLHQNCWVFSVAPMFPWFFISNFHAMPHMKHTTMPSFRIYIIIL